jgi:hypothetical protein
MHHPVARYVRCLSLVVIGFFLSSCGQNAPQGQAAKDPNAAPQPGTPGALALVGGDGELGEADYGQKRTTTFTVKNNTPQPLKLQVSEKSCACSGSEIKPAVLQPGETGEVVVAWVPKLDQQEQQEEVQLVRLWTEIAADNGQKIRLEAQGRIKPALHVNLPRGRLDFGRIDLADLKDGKKTLALEVFTRDSKHQGFTVDAITSHKGLVLDPPPEPLSEDRLAALKAAAGFRISVKCAEGLPAGRFRELLKLKTAAYEQELEVLLEGTVETGAVSMEPEAFDLSAAELSMERGYRAPPLKVTLRYESDRELKIKEVTPKFLHARAVKEKENVWRIELSMPKGETEARQKASLMELEEYMAYGFDNGTVVCETNHTTVPLICIPIRGGKLQK